MAQNELVRVACSTLRRRYPLQQADPAPVTSAVARPLDTAPEIILSESFDLPRP